MIKIAFFDVDGTLLKLGSKVPSFQTVQTLQQLQAKGILLCMATGRGYLSVPHFEGVDFDLWLTFNGSYVRSKDAVISKNPLDADDKRRILHNLKQMHRAAAISNEHFTSPQPVLPVPAAKAPPVPCPACGASGAAMQTVPP